MFTGGKYDRLCTSYEDPNFISQQVASPLIEWIPYYYFYVSERGDMYHGTNLVVEK